MKAKILVYALPVLILTTIPLAEAQQAKKVPRIGYLTAASASAMVPRANAFRQGLRELGYVEGKNILIEYQYADGKLDRLPALAAELVRLNIDIIVSGGPAATRPAREATSTIPIIMAQDGDPVGNGFVASLAQPGGNITGLSTVAPEMSGKRLELLKEIIPKLSRVAVFGNSSDPGNARVLKETELAAAAFGLKLQYFEVVSLADIETAFRSASKGRADAVLLIPNPILTPHRALVADLAVKSRLPVIYDTQYVEAGGLMTYGVNLPDLDRRAATYVDKILKGAKPADLPVEQPTKFEFIINLKAAHRSASRFRRMYWHGRIKCSSDFSTAYNRDNCLLLGSASSETV